MIFSIEIKDTDCITVSHNKELLFKELSLMIDDCIASKGTFFKMEIDSDAAYKIFDKDTCKWGKTIWGKRIG
jgi:hypothetical protein